MTTPPDLAALARLKQIASQATSGPWGANLDHPHGYYRVLQMDGVPIAVLDHLNPQNDTVHMAAFDPSTVLALIAHIEDQAAKLTQSRTAGRAEGLEEVRRLIKGEFYGAPDGRDSAPDHVRQVVDWVLLRIDDVALRKDVGQACAAGMLVAARIADSCGETRAAQGREAGAGVSESDHFAAAGALKAFATHLRALASDPAPGDRMTEDGWRLLDTAPGGDQKLEAKSHDGRVFDVYSSTEWPLDKGCYTHWRYPQDRGLEPLDLPQPPDSPRSIAIAQVAHRWHQHAGCTNEEAWDDLNMLVDWLEEAGVTVKAPAHPTEPGEVERLTGERDRALATVAAYEDVIMRTGEALGMSSVTGPTLVERAADTRSDYLRRHKDACDRNEELDRLHMDLDNLLAHYPVAITEWADGIRAALSTPSPAQPKGETE